MNTPHPYELTSTERRQVDRIVEGIGRHGGLYRTDRDGHPVTDAGGRPVPVDYVVLRSRRFLVDAAGVVWRFFPEGSPKQPDAPDRGGAPWRNNRVEMWTGRWRKIPGPDGTPTYAKVLSPRPIDKRINGHPGMSQIDWYRTHKGYKHPLEAPHAPDEPEAQAPATTATAGPDRGGGDSKPAEASGKPKRSNKRGGGDDAG